jgi:selenocysteine lyase/cysteine desulfurase
VTFGEQYLEKFDQQFSGRRLRLKCAMAAIRAYEYELSRSLLEILSEMPGATIYGLQDSRRLEERVPTFSFTLNGWHPRQVAEELDKSGIFVWDGNYYALAVTERLNLEETGGMVRVGAVHYNTLDEITQFGEALARIALN